MSKDGRILILPSVLYGYDTWRIAPSHVHRLLMLQKRGVRGIFDPENEPCAGGGEETGVGLTERTEFNAERWHFMRTEGWGNIWAIFRYCLEHI
jgi:hypothetical protein